MRIPFPHFLKTSALSFSKANAEIDVQSHRHFRHPSSYLIRFQLKLSIMQTRLVNLCLRKVGGY